MSNHSVRQGSPEHTPLLQFLQVMKQRILDGSSRHPISTPTRRVKAAQAATSTGENQ